jgi:hypothetical protein
MFARIEREGWMTKHPLTGRPTHVVTREWFEETRAEVALLKARIADYEQRKSK